MYVFSVIFFKKRHVSLQGRLNSLKTCNPSLKVLISVGGWTWSGGFSDAALNPGNRDKFVESAVQFMLDNGLDSLDLDWEFPNLIGYGNI